MTHVTLYLRLVAHLILVRKTLPKFSQYSCNSYNLYWLLLQTDEIKDSNVI